MICAESPATSVYQNFDGKTECARAISKVLWPGEKERFLYIDMELFSNSSDLNRLMGAPRGTIGSDAGGKLAIHLSRNPYTLVYLYNFHKANERIIRFFANLFREGLFTDGAGRTIYAGNAIFILSATLQNLSGGIGYNNGIGKQPSRTNGEDQVPQILRNLNIPEVLFQHIKRTFCFEALSESDLRELIQRKIDLIKKQPGIKEIAPEIDRSVIDQIVQHYAALPYTSRKLRAVLQEIVYDKISTNTSF